MTIYIRDLMVLTSLVAVAMWLEKLLTFEISLAIVGSLAIALHLIAILAPIAVLIMRYTTSTAGGSVPQRNPSTAASLLVDTWIFTWSFIAIFWTIVLAFALHTGLLS